MSGGTLVRVTTTFAAHGELSTRHWIVATDNYEIAEFAVLTMENGAEGCRIEAMAITVSPETIEKLGLSPGEAWPL